MMRSDSRDWPTLDELISNTRPARNGCLNWINLRGGRSSRGKITRYRRAWYVYRLTKALNCMDARIKFFNPDVVFRHTCDNSLCVNPEHIVLGSQLDNVRDRVCRGRTRRGNKHPYAKLTEAKVRRIKELVARGKLRKQDIALKFGVSPSTVSAVLSQYSWKHVK